MDEVSEKKKVEETELSLKQNNGQPKYLLKRFSPQENPKETTQLSTQEIKQEKLDINLGLSLGGIYSEKSSGKPLTRSSSIIGVLTPKKDHQELDSPLPKTFRSLSRSCSVPTEAEQEQRKASLMALARRRIESTQRFMGERSKKEDPEQQKSPAREPMPSSPSKVAAWAAASAAKSPALCRALVQIKRQFALYGNRKLEGQEDSAAEKGASHSKSLPMQNDAESKVMLRTISNGNPVKVEETKLENPSKKVKLVNNGFQDNGVDVMKQMPSVTTTGDGPNGKKIVGFLYKYRKGQVSIVCVCHGSSLSPAEFVKHAGGKDVPNPMKHITVCSSFSF
ncbi:ninja-family protein AFP3 [Hevea brasiliensis]|nr:ninja-family protein AFP3 [Hevea brasiliensis]XP_057995615.1 ninja-family protein AFP3 [Hevea brasiliensis]XP_057995616.1 ninja-family protein AFP3 [Hevea brasiliensis]